jgi:hypothetical protein
VRLWRRRRRAASAVDLGWVWVDREAAYELAEVMAGWPEPIDVIHAALELPERWQRAAGRAWHAVLQVAGSQMPLVTATDAEAARMARLMLGSTAITMGDGTVTYGRRKERRR